FLSWRVWCASSIHEERGDRVRQPGICRALSLAPERELLKSTRRREAMKFKITTVLAFCFLAATTVFPQSWDSEIAGSDTTAYIPVVTSYPRVADSRLFGAPGGDVGIGMAAPYGRRLLFRSKTVVELKERGPPDDADPRQQRAEPLRARG